MKFNNPLQLQGPAPAALQFLGQSLSPASATVTLQLPALNIYENILVHVHNPGGATLGIGLWAQVQGPLTALSTFSGAFPPQPTVAALGLPDYEVLLGCANNVGDTLTVTVQFLAAPPAGTNIYVYGVTSPGIAKPTRADGRNYPIGALFAKDNQTALNTFTLVAAPGGGSRIHLKKFVILTSAAAAGNINFIDPIGTISGVSFSLGSVATPSAGGIGAGDIYVPPDGILLDPNTPLQYQVGGTAAAGGTEVSALYDLVPT